MLSGAKLQTRSLPRTNKCAPQVEQDDHDRLWSAIHGLLIALGNLSKLMWPVRGGNPEGLVVRALLHVPEDSPLSHRMFRDSWEHYDERLDTYTHRVREPPPSDEFISPLSGFPEATVFLKAYDREKQTLQFLGRFIELAPLLQLVSHIRQLAWGYGYEAASGNLTMEKVGRMVKGKKGEIAARKAGSWPA